MVHQEQLNQVIAALEKEIASQESKATDLSFDIKVKKAKLKQLKKINDNPGTEKTVDKYPTPIIKYRWILSV
jgi:hypothetical protein